LPDGICTHWKAPPLHGTHPTRTFLDRQLLADCVEKVLFR
jgi:hypothetical protein